MNDATRVIDLGDFDETCQDDAIITLQLLVMLHDEPHKHWRITPSDGGSWDYEKAF